ncbi:fatty acid desaturase [Longilinea arvoryzae]|uniref:Fatty acid desaturase n=1 Tax=Longilinea arvoryzae TaxID=360412 RepID=A0A0S7BP24_9CHLR|nr:fatty acid desaturase [Longilinea arvoryzae]GAP15557.1 fatty acid desaturase [Longilinea arvoryzae]
MINNIIDTIPPRVEEVSPDPQPTAPATPALPTMKELAPLLAPYQRADTRKAVWQLVNTLVPFYALMYAMYRSLEFSYWLTLGLAIPTAGLLVRLFIFFHDCGHNSFLPSRQANKIVGFLLGVLVWTPSEHWWHAHAIHHATSGNLDKRGIGDVTTLTVKEYRALPLIQRIGYRLFRFPLIMFGLGPVFTFFILHRFPIPRFGRKENMNVLWADLAIVAVGAVSSLLLGGFWNYARIFLPVLWIAGMGGIWMFYIQHQFAGAYWARDDQWNYVASALLGASYYKLPRVLQWLSGNIGFHQVHHLSPRIPNYNLEACYRENPLIQKYSQVIRFRDGFQTVRLALIDEGNRNRMLSFHDML